MKKQKIDLSQINIKSFVTDLGKDKSQTIYGGTSDQVPDPPGESVPGPCTGYYCGTQGPGCSPPVVIKER